jgi:hypothetical protein
MAVAALEPGRLIFRRAISGVSVGSGDSALYTIKTARASSAGEFAPQEETLGNAET